MHSSNKHNTYGGRRATAHPYSWCPSASGTLNLCMAMQFALANEMQAEVICVTVCEALESQ